MAISQAAQAELNGERIYCDSQVVHEGFTLKQLQDAFETALAPGANWKNPIMTIADADTVDLMVAAIEFHVGGPTVITERQFMSGGKMVTKLVLTNQGYYANIGA